MIVEHGRAEPERRLAGSEIHLDTIRGYQDCPKQTVRRDVRVVVVDLLGDIRRSNWTGVDVQSDEPERCVIVLAVHRDVLAHHEAHVRLEGERGEASAGPGTANPV